MNSFESPQDVWRKIKKINALKEYEEAVEEIFRNIEITEKPWMESLFEIKESFSNIIRTFDENFKVSWLA